MVLPAAAAAIQATSAAGSGAATALGLSMGKTDLDLTRDLFKLQMRQAKRLWTADWAEASVRHGEACMQSAQQHAEAQAMATATYFQAEKLASQGIKLARDQDSRGYEMAWRAEVRENLRDELANQNNRFNMVMLCDTVCLSCVFSLVADGSPPADTPMAMLHLYVLFVGLSITLFTISLWFSVIVVRRLHEHTAGILERKLFAQSEDLQEQWRDQLQKNMPTGPHEIYLVNQAYGRWVAEYILPFAKASIHMMSIGVVTMFITAGLLVHNQYVVDYNTPLSVPLLFWSTVAVTSGAVMALKLSEDRKEKKKEGIYDISWQDTQSLETGPFAKIIKAQEDLFSDTAVGLASLQRVESYGAREKQERDFVAKTKSLHHRVTSMRKDSERRAHTRKEILTILTTAAEELDALPEELTSQLNKMLHDIDEADQRTANWVTMQSENLLVQEASRNNWSRLRPPPRQAMAPHPIDAQRIPVSLGSLRKKLGEVSLTTLLRLKNLSDEPIRLKSGVQLKEGKYIQRLTATDPQSNTVNYQLYPGTEIPPRTEVVIAARSGGGWVPTSGVVGELVYTNKDESWVFRITFANELLRSVRKCQVAATRAGALSDDFSDDDTDQYWEITRDELDRKSNNEVAISFDVLRGKQANDAAISHRQSLVALKSGFLLKNKKSGLRLQWFQRWFTLTATALTYEDMDSNRSSKIPIRDIIKVLPASNLVKKNVFEVHTSTDRQYKFSAPTPAERDDWVQKIAAAAGIDVGKPEANAQTDGSAASAVEDDIQEEGIECVHSGVQTEVYSPV